MSLSLYCGDYGYNFFFKIRDMFLLTLEIAVGNNKFYIDC